MEVCTQFLACTTAMAAEYTVCVWSDGRMVVAAASPWIGNRQTEVKKDGIAIMMVVDTSSSMRALTLSPENEEQTRLNVVQDTVQDLCWEMGF